VELDRRLVRRPDERGDGVEDAEAQTAAVATDSLVEREPLRLAPALVLVPARPVDSVGEVAKRDRTVGYVRQEEAGDVDVVADQVSFREPALRPQHLVEIRDGEPPTVDLERRHRVRSSPTSAVGLTS
jgi:hypothetical protein